MISIPAPAWTTATALQDLEREVLSHPGVRHPFLERFAAGGLGRGPLRAFGLQHYQLVRIFTTHMTNLAARRPDWAADLRPILDDEFGGHSIFKSHVHLYRDFLAALGLRDEDWGGALRSPETRDFIEGHLALSREGDALETLGALGPGHEFSIPPMFEDLVRGLRASGLAEEALRYFILHIHEDKAHAAAFNGIIERSVATPEAFGSVRRGALYSLELRERFWHGCSRLVFAGGDP